MTMSMTLTSNIVIFIRSNSSNIVIATTVSLVLIQYNYIVKKASSKSKREVLWI